MIEWEQCSGPVHWRSKDRRYSVSEVHTLDGMRYRAIRSGNLCVSWTSALRMSAMDARADAEAHALVVMVTDGRPAAPTPTLTP